MTNCKGMGKKQSCTNPQVSKAAIVAKTTRMESKYDGKSLYNEKKKQSWNDFRELIRVTHNAVLHEADYCNLPFNEIFCRIALDCLSTSFSSSCSIFSSSQPEQDFRFSLIPESDCLKCQSQLSAQSRPRWYFLALITSLRVTSSQVFWAKVRLEQNTVLCKTFEELIRTSSHMN